MPWKDLLKILAVAAIGSFAKAGAVVAQEKADKSGGWKSAGWTTLGGTLGTVAPISDVLLPTLIQPPSAEQQAKVPRYLLNTEYGKTK